MMAQLKIFWNGKLCGNLRTDAAKGMIFSYEPGWEKQISISLPVREKEYSEKECKPFFSGLLPDGEIREQIAAAKHISSSSVFRLLQAYGGDIAGALSFQEDEYQEESTSGYMEISEDEIAGKIRNSFSTPIILQQGTRLSLAGAQQKIPLHYENGKWFVPDGNALSTVILKPCGEYTYSEFVSMSLAQDCNIPVASCRMHYFEGNPALIVDRFDRKCSSSTKYRIHQEDFCQASGILPENKYEADGGPGFAKCLSLIENHSSYVLSDSHNFLKMAVFNFIIGNCDAHAKNFSFLLHDDGKITLAPFYDIVSTTIFPHLDRNFAMKAGKEKRIDRITLDDLLRIGNQKEMKRTVDEICDTMKQAFGKTMNRLPDDNQIEKTFSAVRKDAEIRMNSLYSHLS